ncbi:MAG TPA: YfcE family phosphodiesterase [Planctomycetaceae bacterium]|nr:YfcE family phosphodiesterase [Planctomycetaceae bacterium]
MRILVLADIHSNWPALSAIQESFDACLFIGDLVDYASNPVPCVEWVQAHATAAVRGNHDHAVAQRIVARGGSGFRQLAAATRPLQWKLLAPRHLKYLARLPVTRHLRLGETRFVLVHATPRDPMDEYLADDPGAWLARLNGIEADIVCVGHSHIQFHRQFDRIQVLNPGSVGQPRDGDPRCAYAIIDNGKVELRRVEYDIDATIKHLRESGVEPPVVEMAESALRTGGRLPLKLAAEQRDLPGNRAG